MIELNPEQRQAMAQGRPVRIIDPLTHGAYVLLPAAEYEHLAGAPPRSSGEPHPDIPPMILRSQQAFWRDLPGLLLDRRNDRKWAAYHGDERVTITRSKVDACQECLAGGSIAVSFTSGSWTLIPTGYPRGVRSRATGPFMKRQSQTRPHSTTNEDP